MSGWSKRQFCTQAFSEISVSDYDFDLQPEAFQGALRRLDAMMATWNAQGIRLGYPLPSSPDNSDLDEETGVPDSANEAIYANLAIRIAPSLGKTPTVELKQVAKTAYDVLLSRATFPPLRQLPAGVPLGAGNRRWENPFTSAPADPLAAGADSAIDFE